MNKTKKYLILFLSICFLLIISVGIKQTISSEHSASQTTNVSTDTTEKKETSNQQSQENEDTEKKEEQKTESSTENSSKQETKTTNKQTTENNQKNENANVSQSQQASQESQNDHDQEPVETITYNMVIKGKGSNIYCDNITINDGQTVYDVLQEVTTQNHISFYAIQSQYGMYIVDIGGLRAANYGGSANNGWVYQVNGLSPANSADQYILKSTDRIEWKYLY